jgi:hypothetical protein
MIMIGLVVWVVFMIKSGTFFIPFLFCFLCSFSIEKRFPRDYFFLFYLVL